VAAAGGGPGAAAGDAGAWLPPGWVRQWDMTRQAWFYINSNVQPPQMQWEPPPPPPAAAPGPLAAGGAQAQGAGGGLAGWWARFVNGANGAAPGAGSAATTALVAVPAGGVVAGAGSGGAGVGVGSTESPPAKLLGNAVLGAAGSAYSLGQVRTALYPRTDYRYLTVTLPLPYLALYHALPLTVSLSLAHSWLTSGTPPRALMRCSLWAVARLSHRVPRAGYPAHRDADHDSLGQV